jgi:hypothetical protein
MLDALLALETGDWHCQQKNLGILPDDTASHLGHQTDTVAVSLPPSPAGREQVTPPSIHIRSKKHGVNASAPSRDWL